MRERECRCSVGSGSNTIRTAMLSFLKRVSILSHATLSQ
jgi:hypothetical protein